MNKLSKLSEAQLERNRNAGRASWRAFLKKNGQKKARKIMSARGKRGFVAMANRHFSGDDEAARRFVGDLGWAITFAGTRPKLARERVEKYFDVFPHLATVFTGEKP